MLLYVHRNPRLIRDGSPGWPPGFSLSSWALGTLGFRSRSLLFVVVVFCSPHGGGRRMAVSVPSAGLCYYRMASLVIRLAESVPSFVLFCSH